MLAGFEQLIREGEYPAVGRRFQLAPHERLVDLRVLERGGAVARVGERSHEPERRRRVQRVEGRETSPPARGVGGVATPMRRVGKELERVGEASHQIDSR